MKLMSSLGESSLGYVTVRCKVNRKVNLKRLHGYLSEKDIESADTVGLERNVIKKLVWEEDEDDKWLGAAPKIMVTWDETTCFLLEVSFTVDAKEKEWTDEMELRDVWYKDLEELAVFPKSS